MCLINFAYNWHPNYRLIVAANRDERYDRPTAPADFWSDYPDVLAGRDLEQMGTWMGISKTGRFAALTNYRDPNQSQENKQSRGKIVSGFLTSDWSPEDYLDHIRQHRDDYHGFNILVSDNSSLWYYANVGNEIIQLIPGIHGLSNHLLDTGWPKVVKGKSGLRKCIENHEEINHNSIFEMLADAELADDKELPDTGVDHEWERSLSPIFIKTPHYGTRSSTVLTIDCDNRVTFIERTFSNGGVKENRHIFRLSVVR